jgi:hypothetical protein
MLICEIIDIHSVLEKGKLGKIDDNKYDKQENKQVVELLCYRKMRNF